MADDKKTLKFQMMMSPAEARDLDDWMFKNRVRSRAEAIRRLCSIGIGAEEAILPDVLSHLHSLIDQLEVFAEEQIDLYANIRDEGRQDNPDLKRAFLLSVDQLMELLDQVEYLRLNVQEQAHAVEQIKAQRSTMNSNIEHFSRQIEIQRNKIRDRLIARGYSTEPQKGEDE
ncbi:hypothetical protein [Devosia sp.]|uniref:hypothetical protein n=1 Tax=Devosia sp. TaxID=1871048 RepID=UPI001B145A7B|nr:hypothetical protein [Devosia sp.]MBO9589092.1 hypothetical protein [Devosia sp.]